MNTLYLQARRAFQGKEKERRAESLSARTLTLFALHIQLCLAHTFGLSALFDLFLGLMTANLTWTNEMTPIKQSASAVFSMLSGFAYTILLCAGFMLLDGWKLGFTGYMALFGGVTLALCALLWLWLRNKGCSRFASL